MGGFQGVDFTSRVANTTSVKFRVGPFYVPPLRSHGIRGRGESAARRKVAGFPDPYVCPYSPGCVEGLFSETRHL